MDGSPTLSNSPAVFDFPLMAKEIEVLAFAGECRPGRIRAGRIRPGGAPVLLTMEPAWRIRARLFGEGASPFANQEVRLVVEGPSEGFPEGDGGAPPAAAACLLRDRGGQEHLLDALTQGPGTVAWTATTWTVTWWRTDGAGRVDAFSPLSPQLLSVFVRGNGEAWAEAEFGEPSEDGVSEFWVRPGSDSRRGAPFRLRYEDGAPVASQKVIAQPARFPAGLRVAWTEIATDAEGRVDAGTLSPDVSYRFIVAPMPPVPSGGWRWAGDQGVGVPSADAVIVLREHRPMLTSWTGWQEGPAPAPK
jgi:hypothetical protein